MLISSRSAASVPLMGRSAITPRSRQVATHRGCSLVELLVAIVVFTTGALALAGSSALVLKKLSRAHVNVASAVAVSSRFVRLAATRCSALAPGNSQPSPGLMESWTAEPVGGGRARARVTMQFEPDAHLETVHATITCR